MVRSIVVVFLCLVSVCVSKTSYKVSEMSEEENTVYGSRFLTANQKCEGCTAISHQFHLAFELKHKNRPESLGDLPDHEIIEALEMTCDPRNQRFNVYGLRDGKDGSHRLTGPGLVGGSGVAHMGGKTPTRLSDSCEMYLEADEMAIYDAWIRGNKTPKAIKEYLCKNPHRTNVPKSVSEELDLSACLKDGIKHIADEL